MKKPLELTSHTGIIINASKYRDKDCVVSLVGDGVKGVYRAINAYLPTNKNHVSTLVFSKVRLDVGGYSDHPSISSTVLLKNHAEVYENLFFSSALAIVQDIIINLFQDGDHIQTEYLESLLDFKNPNDGQILFGVLVTILHLSENLGILDVSLSCPVCGKKLKRTACYDFELGGLICNDCQEDNFLSDSKEDKIKILIKAYKVTPDKMMIEINKMFGLELIEELARHIENSVGYHMKSLENFKKWFFNL
ncbi:MAG TPA: hypothetical protein DCY93_03990 [Firmicutes bacterium]|nr:hypothetical protein [Bacillota bacterium]